jgi:hypothetical protein
MTATGGKRTFVISGKLAAHGLEQRSGSRSRTAEMEYRAPHYRAAVTDHLLTVSGGTVPRLGIPDRSGMLITQAAEASEVRSTVTPT